MRTFCLFILSIVALNINISFSQTQGNLEVRVTTSNAGGVYAPRNIVAIWIEDPNSNYVKTLLAYANEYKTHLNYWQASTTNAGTPFNTFDAITGPTINNHGTRVSNWNAKNFNNLIVADGNYRVCFELTDKNATGNYSCFNFNKSNNQVTLTPANVPSFSSIKLTWTPSTTDIDNNENEKQLYWLNNSNNVIHFNQNNYLGFEIFDVSGKKIINSTENNFNIEVLKAGIYILKINTTKGKYTSKIAVNF